MVASGESSNFGHVPALISQWQLNPDAAYLHVCSNETIGGVQLNALPDVPARWWRTCLRTFCRRPIDCQRFGLIYAGAQKNIGPAGLAVVIVSADLLGQCPQRYARDARLRGSCRCRLDVEHPANLCLVSGRTGVQMAEGAGWSERDGRRQRAQSGKALRAVDQSNFLSSPVATADRSQMNVPFTLPDAELDASF